jgi:hypothetical protein
MLKANKLVQIEAPSREEISSFTLSTAAGRDALAQRIEKDINDWCQKQYDDGPRTHLGASIIGHECERFIWFGFRWMFYEVHSGRMQRLFQRGHLEEDRIIEWLTGIGFAISQVDIDGKQFRIVFAEGHGGGSSDGIGRMPVRYCVNEPVLLECKTQKDKRFSILQGSGVQKEKPQHFIQASIYGRRLGLRYCLYIAVNKENDDLDVELIELDWGLAEAEEVKAEKIIDSKFPPPRISENPSFWKCKMCSANPLCHQGAPVMKNCRSCCHSEPMPAKQWRCNQWNAMIPESEIPKGCDAWSQLPTR